MFQVIENARMMVGTKAIATLSTGYLNALEFAKSRVQGPDLPQAADKTAPRVTITHHPDVRRSPDDAEGVRRGAPRAGALHRELAGRRDDRRAQRREERAGRAVNDLLLPIVKGYGSERSWVLLGTESLQTFGGSGFLQEYPIEQYVRDAKIDTLYEGTTAIQGQDFFFRKIVKDQAQALGHLAGEIEGFVKSEAGNGRLKVERELLATALEDGNAIVAAMIGQLMSADASAEGGDVRNIYKVGLNTSRLLMALGDIVCSWLLLRQAEVALEKLGGDGTVRQGQGLLRGQGRGRAVLRAQRAAEADRRASDRRVDGPVAHGRPRGRVLTLTQPIQVRIRRLRASRSTDSD